MKKSSNHVFPKVMYSILEGAASGNYKDIISWHQNGKLFKIHDRQRFIDEICPKHEQKFTSYKSCARQLNLWGFTCMHGGRECPEKGYYGHPLFVRGKPELLNQIARKTSKRRGPQQNPPNSSEEIETSGEDDTKQHSVLVTKRRIRGKQLKASPAETLTQKMANSAELDHTATEYADATSDGNKLPSPFPQLWQAQTADAMLVDDPIYCPPTPTIADCFEDPMLLSLNHFNFFDGDDKLHHESTSVLSQTRLNSWHEPPDLVLPMDASDSHGMKTSIPIVSRCNSAATMPSAPTHARQNALPSWNEVIESVFWESDDESPYHSMSSISLG